MVFRYLEGTFYYYYFDCLNFEFSIRKSRSTRNTLLSKYIYRYKFKLIKIQNKYHIRHEFKPKIKITNHVNYQN